MIKYLWECTFAKQTDYLSQFRNVVKYLTQNRYIYMPKPAMDGVYQQRTFTKTVINELFERMMTTDYISEICAIYPVMSKYSDQSSIPDLVTMPYMVMDLKNNPIAQPLSQYSEFHKKIIVNVAQVVKRNEATRELQVSDINELHSMYVRALLTRSFSVSNGWLTPSLSYFITKAYALCVSGMIARSESLSYQDQMSVAMVFALYMSQQFARTDEDPARPRSFMRCQYLGDIPSLENLSARAAELNRDGLTLENCCQLIQEIGPQRLKKFNLDNFYRATIRLGPVTEPIPTRIALEYVPYFTYMLLTTLSGAMGGSLQSLMKQFKLIGTESKKFIDEIKVSQALFESR